MYSEGRQNSTSDKQLFEESLVVIANVFNANWLSSGEGNPLQQAWNRRDWLASAELINVANGLMNIDVNSPWARDIINKIKTGDARNRQGAIFELVMAGVLNNPPSQVVQLPPSNTPGYDLIAKFPDKANLYVSLKNYRTSTRAQAIRSESRKIEEILTSTARRNVQLIVTKETEYPTPSDWRELSLFITENINRLTPGIYRVGDWQISNIPFDPQQGRLYNQKLSYTLIVNTPYHRNEERNLFSRLDEACANIDHHGQSESHMSANMVLIRIPVEVSIDQCADWSREYLAAHPNAQISGVALYQPAVTTTVDGAESQITHSFQVVVRPERTEWFTSGRAVSMVIPVGAVSTQSSKIILQAGNQTVDIGNRYMYQSGHHYFVAQSNGAGSTLTGNMTVRQGIHTHSYVPIGDQGMEISGIFPPQHELILL